VLRIIDVNAPYSVIYRLEPCECHIKQENEKQKFYENQFRQELKEKCNRLFPLEACDSEFKAHVFGNFNQVKGTELIYKAAKDFADNFDNKYKPQGLGLLFTGNYGGGKTRLMKTILKYRSKWDICVFVNWETLIERIFATYSKESNENEQELMKCLYNCDILAIDDIGVGEQKPSIEKKLLNIINERLQKRKSVLFTMNPEGEALLKPRIRRRIDEMCLPVVCTAEDYSPIVRDLKLNLGV
jgi:DNA replication protein DnaC